MSFNPRLHSRKVIRNQRTGPLLAVSHMSEGVQADLVGPSPSPRGRGIEGPTEALEQIRLLGDACHNLPGVIGRRPPAPGDIDPFIGPWRDPREHDWMARVLKAAELDTFWLDAAPRWPSVVAPVERPRPVRDGIRLPRNLREYRSVGTAMLRSLGE